MFHLSYLDNKLSHLCPLCSTFINIEFLNHFISSVSVVPEMFFAAGNIFCNFGGRFS